MSIYGYSATVKKLAPPKADMHPLKRLRVCKEWFCIKCNAKGKTIIPFCTSGGSGVGRSDTELHKNVSGDVKWGKGIQINRPNETEIRKWLEKVL